MKGRAKQIYEMLTERFPKAFPADARECRPLKIGIKDDLARELPEEDHRYISIILGHHTHRPVYLKGLLTHQERIDLHGNPAGEVTDVAREVATRWHEEAKARTKAKAKEAKERATKAQQQAMEAAQRKAEKEAKKAKKGAEPTGDNAAPKKAKKPPQAPPKPEPPAAASTTPKPKPSGRPVLSLKGKK